MVEMTSGETSNENGPSAFGNCAARFLNYRTFILLVWPLFD